MKTQLHRRPEERVMTGKAMPNVNPDRIKLFTGRSNPDLTTKICQYLEVPMGRGRSELFHDGELMVQVD
jgi:hypothetical protein